MRPEPTGPDFLVGIGAPACWEGKQRFVILDDGFGDGARFFAAWLAWRDDPARSTSLHFIAIEPDPGVLAGLAAAGRDARSAPLAAQLIAAWPPHTPGLHPLAFDGGAVQLLLVFGDIAGALPKLHAEVDAFLVATSMETQGSLEGTRRFCKALARLAAPDASVTSATNDTGAHDALLAAGFNFAATAGGLDRVPERSFTVARFAPRHHQPDLPRRAASRAARVSADEPVVIVGAGLAGSAVAAALAEQGRTSVVLDRRDSVAAEASGNAAGLFHGVVHRADGRHARWHRAAALAARGAVSRALAQGERGSVGGLLRIEPEATDRGDMQDTIDRLGLPADYVRAVEADEASEIAAARVSSPAWYFPHGGWIDPRGLARSFLGRAGDRVDVRLGVAVATLRREGERWALRDADGRLLFDASVVVLANAGGALDLLGHPAWPMTRSRGQLSASAAAHWAATAIPRVPVAGAGYVMPAIQDSVWFGASAHVNDGEAGVRRSDHAGNVARLQALLTEPPMLDIESLAGRTAFRWSSDDRLPVIGAVPSASLVADANVPVAADSRRHDQPRFVPRAPGLFVMTALGSRGIAAASLGGSVLAALVTGAPVPLETDLLDAIDPARFVSRAVRRGGPDRLAGTSTESQPGTEPAAGGSAGT